MKTHYSVSELLELDIKNLPKSRKGLDKYLVRNNWKYKEIPSRGIGGVRKEYEPPVEIMNQIHESVLISETKNSVINELSTLQNSELANQLRPYAAAELDNTQRQYAENRLHVVRYIQKQIDAGFKKTRVIEDIAEKSLSKTLPDFLQDAVLKANAKCGTERGVSRRTLLDWVKAVDEAEKRKVPVIAALAPKARQSDIPKWAAAFLAIHSKPQKPTIAASYELLREHLKTTEIECPSYGQVYRFYNEKLGNVEKHRGRMGSREIKNIKPFIRRDTSSLLPTYVYTADGHCFDAEVAHPANGRPFKPELTVILDVATRRVVGWSVDLAENTFAVLDALRMACCEHGIPGIFYVDNGSGYKNKILEDQSMGVLNRLHTTVKHSLPYNSQAKGLMERSHQSIWVKAAQQLPTYIGKPMDAQAAQSIHKKTRKEIELFGSSKTLPSWNDFLLYVELKVEQYNNKPHSALKRIVDPETLKRRYQSPCEAWAEALEMGTPIDKVEDWDKEDLFRPYMERKVLRCEISLFNNRYFSKDLEEYNQDTVLVGYDIHNAEKITVRNVDGQFICHAIWNANKRDYFPKSVVEQAVENRAAGRKHRLDKKMLEVLQEVNPTKVLEHLEDQSNVIFTPRAERLVHQMAEPILVEQPVRRPTLVQEAPAESIELTAKEKMQRWIVLDSKVMAGIEVTEDERSFWTSFQLSRVFKSFKENDAELIEYLAQRQA